MTQIGTLEISVAGVLQHLLVTVVSIVDGNAKICVGANTLYVPVTALRDLKTHDNSLAF